MDITGWQYILEPLSKVFQLILLDNRGTGRSEVTPGKYTTRLLADDAAALLDQLQIEKAHVLGWSMGHMYHIEYPEIFARTVIEFLKDQTYGKPDFAAAARR